MDERLERYGQAMEIDPQTNKPMPRITISNLEGNYARQPFSGTSNKTHKFTSTMTGFVISNDGDKSLHFTIGGDTYEVRAYEVFEETFSPFTDVTIASTVPYRAYGRSK